MKSFTAMSFEGREAVIQAQREDFLKNGQYEIRFNTSDFQSMVESLNLAYIYGDEQLSDWASSFLSGIASTLGIEFI